MKIEKFEKPILKDVNIEMKLGDFLVVVGQVGCGKTSLISYLALNSDKKFIFLKAENWPNLF